MTMYSISVVNTPKLMGIVNVTPDSFSDGGKYYDPENAIEHACQLVRSGADIIDFGAESTRPGAKYLDADIEINRLASVIAGFRKEFPSIPISIDTRKSQVIDVLHKYKIDYINDITALRHDPSMIDVILSNPDIQVVLMHMKGEPSTMQKAPEYSDVIEEVLSFFDERINYCLKRGIRMEQIFLDPGIGFGKKLPHNLAIINGIGRIKSLGFPIILGTSRKSFINDICPSDPKSRIAGTLASSMIALLNGIDIIRVHDVFEHKQFFQVLHAITEDLKWTF